MKHKEKFGQYELEIDHHAGNKMSYAQVVDGEGEVKASGYVANDATGLEGNINIAKQLFAWRGRETETGGN